MDNLLYYLRLTEEDGLFFFWTKEVLIALGIFFLFFGLSKIVRLILVKRGAGLAARLHLDPDGTVVARITPPASFLFVCAGLFFAFRELPLPEKLHIAVSGVLFVVNMVVITVIAYRVSEAMLARFASRVGSDELSRQLLPLTEKLVSIFLIATALIITLKHFDYDILSLVIATALIITLKHFDYDILSLVTALGIGSLAIGLAAKDTMANMVSGFTLMLDRPFRIGDTIRLAGGQLGEVVDIGLRSTKLKGADNTYLIIPNSELCNTTIVNLAFPDVKLKGRIDLKVEPDCDVAKAKLLMEQIAAANPEVLADPAPQAYFVSFGDSALALTLMFWVAHYRDLFAITDRINCAILKSFQENGITIPSPRTVILEREVKHAPQD